MSLFAAFPFLRLIIPFLLGIITAIYIECRSDWWSFAVCFVFALVLLETFVSKVSGIFRYRWLAGLLFHLLFFLLGIFLVKINHQRFYSNHFSHFPAEAYCGEISDPPVEKKRSHKVVLQVQQVKVNGKWKPVTGKLLVYIQQSDQYQPRPGDVLLFKSQVQDIQSAKNPGQFDYRQYLYYHNIYQQTYLKAQDMLLVKREGNALKNFAYDLRQRLIASFEKSGLKGNELAVASALLFGVTDQLDPGLIRAYAGTGALHVLSVSGLHVGIIYGFLQLALSFLYARKNGRLFAGLIILLFIWFYAMLTGLTPSVLRSSTMFTFIVIGQALHRQSSVFNSIAASAFVLLCYDPFLVMEVGFQLSYLAVTGIVVLHPIIFNQLLVKNKWLKQVWSITAVSIAAQMATLPLGLLYFHQFPNYFIFSNLLIIPLSGLILYVGIVASFLYAWPWAQKLFVQVTEFLIVFMNKAVIFIEQLPYALVEGISITIAESCLLYSMLLLWLAWYKTSEPRYMKMFLLPAVVICMLQVWENDVLNQQEKIVVYHVPQHTAIDIIYSRQHIFIADSSFYHDPDQLLFNVKHHWDDLDLETPKVFYTEHLPDNHTGYARIKKNILLFRDLSLQIVNEGYNYKTDTLKKTSVILLSHNPRINLEKLPFGASTPLVIADGSNKLSRIRKWAEQARKKHIGFYNIAEMGAYVREF